MNTKHKPLANVLFAALLLSTGIAMADDYLPVSLSTLSSGELAELSSQLKDQGEPASGARVQLAQFISTQRMSDAASIKAVPLGQWKEYAASLKTDMTDAERVQWSTKLRNAYLGDSSAVVVSSSEDALRLSETLNELGDANAFTVLADNVVQTDDWKNLESKDLGDAAFHMNNIKDSGTAARARIASHLTSSVVTVPSNTRTIKPKQWQTMSWDLTGELSDSDKTAWLNGIKAAYIDDSANLASASTKDLYQIATAMTLLGHRKGCPELAGKVETLDDWKSFDSRDLKLTIWQLNKLKSKGQPALGRIAGHMTNVYMDNISKVAEETDAQYWDDVVWQVNGSLSSEQRTKWATTLRSAYAGSEEAIESLDPEHMFALVSTLNNLGDTKSNKVIADYVCQADGWKKLKPLKMPNIIMPMVQLGEEGKEALSKVADYVESDYLKDSESISQITPAQWEHFAYFLGGGLPDSRKSLWVSKLRAEFIANQEKFDQLSSKDTLHLSKALQELGEFEPGVLLVPRITKSTDWHELDGKGLRDLAMKLSQIGYMGQESREKVVEHITKTYTANEESVRQLTCRQWGILARDLSTALTNETKKIWATEIKRTYCADLDALDLAQQHYLSLGLNILGDQEQAQIIASKVCMEASQAGKCGSWSEQRLLVEMAESLFKTDAYKNNENHIEYANYFASLARAGLLSCKKLHHFEYLALPLCTSDTIDILQKDLIDDFGCVRLPVAYALAWAYAQAGRHKEWLEYVSNEMDSASDSDTRAYWMLVRGISEGSAKPVVGLRQPKVYRWCERAISTASSNKVKKECIEQLVSVHLSSLRFDDAISAINDIENDSEDFDWLALTTALKARIEISRNNSIKQEIRRERDKAEKYEKLASDSSLDEDQRAKYQQRAVKYRERENSYRLQLK